MPDAPAKATRPLRPPLGHDWQEYMDGEVQCSACGVRRVEHGYVTVASSLPCVGAGKVTVDA